MRVLFSTSFYGHIAVEPGDSVSFVIDEPGDYHSYITVLPSTPLPDGSLPVHAIWEGERDDLEREAKEPLEDGTENTDAVQALIAVRAADEIIARCGYFPPQKVPADEVAAYTAEQRAKYRDALIRRIEGGDLNAVKSLKENFGESIRLSVEVIGEAA